MTEPVTMLTDYALTALAWVFAVRLACEARARRCRAVGWWAMTFAATGLAALAGGTFHGFQGWISAPVLAALWKTVVFSMGFCGWFLLVSASYAYLMPPARAWLVAVASAKWAIYVAWMASNDTFLYVIVDYGISMLAVLVLQVATESRRRDPSALWIVTGILVSAIAGFVQVGEQSLWNHFTRNDLYHLIQMFGLWLLFRGGRIFKDR